jgi:hypothetical protein
MGTFSMPQENQTLFLRFLKTALNGDPDMNKGLGLLNLLFLILLLALMAVALWPTCWFLFTFSTMATAHYHWVLLILGAVLIFNFTYIVALLILRLFIPKLKEGFYRSKDGRLPRQGFIFMLNAFLTAARYRIPWAFITSALTNIFPVHPVYRRLFGPNTPTILLWDLCNILDPSLVEAGKNVVFGIGSTIACHVYDHRGLLVRKVKIGDHAVIGAYADIVLSDVGHHAIIAARSVLTPNTVIGPYELWAGNPARKIRDLRKRE